MKRYCLLFIFLSLICFSFFACKEDEEKITLSLEKTNLVFSTAEAQEERISFKTNAIVVSIEVPAEAEEWCRAVLEKESIVIVVNKNQSTADSRITTITVIAEGADIQTIKVTQPPREKSSQPELKSFLIPAELNGLKDDIEGVIDEENHTITIATNAWIANVKSLIAKFEVVGSAYIGETKQISETTPNSFYDKLTLRVNSEDESQSIDYEIVTTGPMFTGLPIISVDIEDGLEVVEKTLKLPATLYLVDPEKESFDMREQEITIRGRGNTSWHHPKKPYRIDFPSKTSVFGLTKAKKWILLSNYQDATLLMNDVAFELGRRFGLQFTHSSIHIELFVNGSYRGNYQFTEQKEIGKGRVDVDEKEGFLVELDAYFDEDYKFLTNHLSLPAMVAGPDLNSEDEMEYIKREIQGLEDTLFENNFPNTSYEKYTDVPSLIDFILINEIARNRELWTPKSVYCYKDVDTKIKWGPLWDFDWAFGYNGKNAYFDKNNLIFSPNYENHSPGELFFCRFLTEPTFRAKYKARWQEVRPLVVDVLNYIDRMSVKLDKSQTENFKLSKATPNTKNASYEELISQMKAWLSERIAMLDRELEKF